MTLEPEDQEIVDFARAGGRSEALERFVARHGPRLAAACRRLGGSVAEGEDTMQELLVQVDRSLPTFRSESSLYSWAFRIAVHVSLNRRRNLAARATHVDVVDAEGRLVAGERDGGDPDFSCVSSFRSWLVEQALLALPEAQRTALTLHDLEEMTAAEAGALLGIDANAVKQRVHRARRNLRQRIAREFAARGVALEAMDEIGCVSGLFAESAASGLPARPS
jgi:RNA polymerase sigma-70 factor (ECF subfamily)